MPDTGTQELTRREFLKGSTTFLGGAVVGGTLDRIHEAIRDAEPAKIYTDGEVIETPQFPIDIEGWNLIFRPHPFREATKDKNNDRYFLSIPDENGTLETGSFSGMTYQFLDKERENKAYIAMRVLPHSNNEDYFFRLFQRANLGEQLEAADTQLVVLNRVSRDGDRIVGIQSYPIAIKFYTYQPKPHTPEFIGRHRVVYSEIPLQNTILEEIHRHIWLFSSFNFLKRPVPVFIRNEAEERGGVFDYDNYRIHLPSVIFTNPEFENEGLAKLDHELAHAIMQGLGANSVDQRLNIRIYNAYKDLVEGAGFQFPFRPNILGSIPTELLRFFEIFDESSYVEFNNKSGSDYGHPWQNFHELFASGLTVLRYFPHKFVEKYNNLPEDKRKLVKEVVEAIISVPRAYYKEKFSKILPEHQQILESLNNI